jgi:DNA helicase-2/ATP-dependent DNA helicase PcrA
MDLRRELNPEQRKAVLHKKGPLLILAGAGSGKTRVLTYRIAQLVEHHGIPPWQILAVTFTNKAAGEMRERIGTLVGDSRGLWALTFHSFGARVLRRHADLLHWGRDFTIYNEDDARRLGRMVLKELDLDPEQYRVERMLQSVERAKRKLKSPHNSQMQAEEQAFYRRYQQSLQKANAFDFSDLIFQPNRLLMENPDIKTSFQNRFQYILVDEFQDTDKAQFSLIKLVCNQSANLCVVGDDDQAIYHWRGADVSNILDFKKHYPNATVIKLERNYRSSANILNAASRIIHRNTNRHAKELWTKAEPGEPVRIEMSQDEQEEARRISWKIRQAENAGIKRSEMAVFYRVNAQSRALEEGLRYHGIPYRVVGGTRFFDRAEVRNLLAYLRLIANPRSEVDLLRILNVPARGLGDTTRQRLLHWAEKQGCSLLEAIKPEFASQLRKKERHSLLDFGNMIRDMQQAATQLGVDQIIRMVIERSGYGQLLQQQGTLQSQARLENLEELISAGKEFSTHDEDDNLSPLLAFLEHVALVTDVDTADLDAEVISLMTLHTAKGLEFDLVFMTGMEEGLLPHRRSLTEVFGMPSSTKNGIDEERRLCYVGITRARKSIYLSCTRRRTLAGRTEENLPSRFLQDIPNEQPAGLDNEHLCDLDDFDLDETDDIISISPTGSFSTKAQTNNTEFVDYDMEYNQDANLSHGLLGRKVSHPTFGYGRVKELQPSAMGPKVTVDFDAFGRKTVIAKYLKLS